MGRFSVKAGVSNALVVYPPKSLFAEQLTAIRVLQLGSGLAVCPPGMHVLYLSTLCDNDDQGKTALLSAMSMLIGPQVTEKLQSDSVTENDTAEAKPVVLWRALTVRARAGQGVACDYEHYYLIIIMEEENDGAVEIED